MLDSCPYLPNKVIVLTLEQEVPIKFPVLVICPNWGQPGWPLAKEGSLGATPDIAARVIG